MLKRINKIYIRNIIAIRYRQLFCKPWWMKVHPAPLTISLILPGKTRTSTGYVEIWWEHFYLILIIATLKKWNWKHESLKEKGHKENKLIERRHAYSTKDMTNMIHVIIQGESNLSYYPTITLFYHIRSRQQENLTGNYTAVYRIILFSPFLGKWQEKFGGIINSDC